MTKRLLLCTAALAIAVPAIPASAQEVQEVIVTARKRQESILNVPVVETVITQKGLEQAATHDLSTLKSYVPGLLMGTSTNSVGLQVSLRGIGTTAQNATMDQSVALNIDGLPITQGVAYAAGMFDVAQVEVLRGPQNLFYGKNSPGGVISLRSADPTDEFEVMARGGYEFVARNKLAEFVVSGPVTDTLKARLAVHLSDEDGYFRNTSVALPGYGSISPVHRRYPSTESWMVRGTVLFDPNEAYSARLKVNYTSDNTQGATSPTQVVYCPDGTTPVTLPYMAGENCKIDRNFNLAWPDPAAFTAGLPNGGEYFNISEQAFGTLEQNLKIGNGLTLTSVTGIYDNWYDSFMHGSSTAAIMPFAQAYKFGNRQFTQEVRLTSDWANSPLNFMAGGFYQSGTQTNQVNIVGNTAIHFPAVLQRVDHRVDIEAISAFGQAIWKVTPQIELAGGARWTHEERKHEETNLNPGNGPVGRVDLIDPKIHSNNVSPEVSLTYKPTSELTLFGNYKQGFKSGSFNSVNFIPATTPSSFEDEKVKGFEVGLKSLLLDRRLAFNIAAYTYKYSNLQVGALILQQTGGGLGNLVVAQRVLNAASARVKGVDMDATFNPPGLDGLSLRGSLNYNRARYISFPNAPCGNGQTIAQGCDQFPTPGVTPPKYNAQDLSGRPLVRAPEWAGTLGFTYDRELANGMSFTLASDVNYTSEYVTTLVDLPGFRQPGFAKLNASVTLRSKDDVWEVSLIGNNVTDKVTRGLCFASNVQNGTLGGGQISGSTVQGPAKNDENTCAVDPGREVWVRVTWRPTNLLRR
jgi:iron complex outermembrane receptor protein